jgi:hypothetical protein
MVEGVDLRVSNPLFDEFPTLIVYHSFVGSAMHASARVLVNLLSVN